MTIVRLSLKPEQCHTLTRLPSTTRQAQPDKGNIKNFKNVTLNFEFETWFLGFIRDEYHTVLVLLRKILKCSLK